MTSIGTNQQVTFLHSAVIKEHLHLFLARRRIGYNLESRKRFLIMQLTSRVYRVCESIPQSSSVDRSTFRVRRKHSEIEKHIEVSVIAYGCAGLATAGTTGFVDYPSKVVWIQTSTHALKSWPTNPNVVPIPRTVLR